MALVKNSTLWAKKFYRHTFEMRVAGIGSVMLHTLLVNPETMDMDEPARASVTQTLGGAFVTDFGQGLPTVVLAGTTGYRKRVNAERYETDGFEEFMNFRNRVYRDFIKSNDPKLTLYWYNWEDDEYYQIQPISFRLMRNKTEPLLYRYEFRFTCLQKLKNAKRAVTNVVKDPSTRTTWLDLSKRASTISEFLHELN